METIRRAHAVHPLTALQTEYSLATRDVEKETLPVCQELGIGFVAYSPLSRGLMSGVIRSLGELTENDHRRAMPRFQGDNLGHNLQMVDAVSEIASEKGVSIAAISIAWVLAQGENIVPIPGCSRRATLKDFLMALQAGLSVEDVARIEAAASATDADALHCQRETCDLIVQEGGSYCLQLKGDQGDMKADVRAFIDDQETDYIDEYTSTDADHGRVETRCTRVCTAPKHLDDIHKWPSLKAFVCDCPGYCGIVEISPHHYQIFLLDGFLVDPLRESISLRRGLECSLAL